MAAAQGGAAAPVQRRREPPQPATVFGARRHNPAAAVAHAATLCADVEFSAEDAGRKRYSAFIVPRDTAGLTMADMPDFHALRPSKHCLLTLQGCLVPETAMLGDPGSAYDRMALPFRDIEDAVGTFATLGALRYAIGLFAGATLEQTDDLGAIVALAAVYEAGAASVVAALDTGRFRTGDATLVGLRVLAIDMVSRLRAIAVPAAAEILADLDATLNIARGPRLARQTHLGVAALRARQ